MGNPKMLLTFPYRITTTVERNFLSLGMQNAIIQKMQNKFKKSGIMFPRTCGCYKREKCVQDASGKNACKG
jgi:hypothetical protein